MRPRLLYLFLGIYLLGNSYVWSHFGRGFEERGTCSLAFGILVSRTDWQTFPRMFAKIYQRDSLYCIHIDRKLNSSVIAQLRAVIASVSRQSHRTIVLPSRDVTYRGISHTLTLLDLMECAVQSRTQWKFWLNLSGSDYPLLSTKSIHELLCDEAPFNVSYLSLSARVPHPDIYARWQSLYIDPSLSKALATTNKLERLSTKHPFFPPNIQILKGSDWFIFGKELTEWILKSSQGRWLLAYFTNSVSTSESYFHTLISTSEHDFVADNLRFSIWGKQNNNTNDQHPWFLDSITFWTSIQQSGGLFARKMTASSPLLELIDAQMHRGCDECKARARERLLAKAISKTELRMINLLPNVAPLDR